MAITLHRQLLDAVIRQMPAGVIVAEVPTGRIIALNESAHTIWRRTAPQSQSVDEYASYEGFHPDGRPYRPDEWPLARAILHNEVVQREEVRILRGDGTYGVIRISAAPIHDEAGQTVAAVVTFIDITDDRRERESLAILGAASAIVGESLDSGETVRRLARLAVPGFADAAFVYLLSDTMRLQRTEAAAADPELKARLNALWERFPPSPEPLQHVLESGTVQLHEQLTEADWETIADPEQRRMLRELGFTSVINVPLRVSERIYGVMTFVRVDATPNFDRHDVALAEEIGRRAAAALEKSVFFEAEREHRLRAETSERRIADLQSLTSALATAITIDDVANRITNVLERVVGARGIVLVIRDETRDVVRVVRAVGFDEATVEGFREMPLHSQLPLTMAVATARPIWKRNRAEFVLNAPILESVPTTSRAWAALPLGLDGHAIGAVGFSFSEEQPFDEDDQNFLLGIAGQCAIALERARLFESERHAREEAERASRAKDEFLAILSHELRTPMTTVIGWADFLRMTHADDPEITGPIDALRNSARLQAKLVDDLLDVSRIIANKLTIRVAETDLSTIARHAIEDVRMSAERKGVELGEMLDERVPISGDPDRLRQIVTNLLVNAIKFTPAGGRVTVQVQYVDGWAELRVSDTGEGISPEFLPHVFDRFRQASVGDSRRHSGLGLGLSIVQHLVERHGGTVGASSEGLGKGATFTVRLPASA
ncbi:MAG TPA: ATP-binding protein [Thermoanaerobaculia bacterium]